MIAIFDIQGTLRPFASKKIKNEETTNIDSVKNLMDVLNNRLDEFNQILINTEPLSNDEYNNIIAKIDTPKKQVKILIYSFKNGLPSLMNATIFNSMTPEEKQARKEKKQQKSSIEMGTIRNPFSNKHEHLCIGVSTGGPTTLEMVIPQFPKDIDVSIVVIQHMLRGKYIYSLCDRLNKISQIEVKVAEDGEILRKGVAYFPPPGRHLYYKRQPNQDVSIHLTESYPKTDSTALFEQDHRFIHIPSVDIGMESASDIYKDKLIAVILTGMGCDGAVALKYARDNGAHTLSEAEETCVVYGMPKAAFERKGSMEVLKHYLIPNRILEIINYKQKK